MSSESCTVQSSITGFWNQVAPHYEGGPGNTAAFGSDMDRLWADLIARVLPPPPADVLDLGTGTGFVALHAAALGHRVVGIDLARDMLAVARQQAAERDLQVRFEEGDAVDPPFEPAAFNAITCRHLLWTLRHATDGLPHWYDILRPGGCVIVFDGFRPQPQPGSEIDPDDLFGRHYGPEVQAAIPFFGVQDEAPLVSAFREAGFVDVQLDPLPLRFVEDTDVAVRPYIIVATRGHAAPGGTHAEVRTTSR